MLRSAHSYSLDALTVAKVPGTGDTPSGMRASQAWNSPDRRPPGTTTPSDEGDGTSPPPGDRGKEKLGTGLIYVARADPQGTNLHRIICGRSRQMQRSRRPGRRENAMPAAIGSGHEANSLVNRISDYRMIRMAGDGCPCPAARRFAASPGCRSRRPPAAARQPCNAGHRQGRHRQYGR